MELDASGEKPLYKPRKWRALEQARERRKVRTGDFDTVIFVPATHGFQRSKPQILRSRLFSNHEQPLKPCYKGQTPSNRRDALMSLMLTAFSAGLTGRDHAKVQALHMSWFVRLVNRSMSEKRPEVRILVVKNTSML